MRIFVAIDITNFLCRSGHFAVSSEVVEKHESRIKINPFENIIGDKHAHKLFYAFIFHESIVEIADEFIAVKQHLIVLPLIKNGVTLFGRADGVEHITIAL